MSEETPSNPEVEQEGAQTKVMSRGQVERDLLDAKAKLLWHVQNEKNWYQITSAAYAYALISGNLTNATAPSYPVR